MKRKGAPGGAGMLSIGAAVELLQEGMDEARTFLFPRRRQRKKQRT